jgi:acetyl esterase
MAYRSRTHGTHALMTDYASNRSLHCVLACAVLGLLTLGLGCSPADEADPASADTGTELGLDVGSDGQDGQQAQDTEIADVAPVSDGGGKDLGPNDVGSEPDAQPDVAPDVAPDAQPDVTPDAAPDVPTPINEDAYEALDVVYRTVDGQELALDVRVPAGPGPFPAVLLIHGGGFSSGDKAQGVASAWSEYLPTMGYASISANYRLSGGGPDATGVFPGPLQDVKCALRWTRSRAQELRINPDAIFSLGHSAGGYFSAALVFTGNEPSLEGTCEEATTTDSSVAGGVSFYGIADFTTLAGQRSQGQLNGAESNLVGGASCLPGALEPSCGEASPSAYVNAGDPPIYLLHADNDTTIPVEQSQELHQQLTAMGLSSEYLEVSALGHGWAGTFESPMVAEIRDGVMTWLDLHSDQGSPEELPTYPLYFTAMTHLEGEMAYDEVQPMYNAATAMMEVALDTATEYDAKLTIESEQPFALACGLYGENFLQSVLDKGHGVGTHCDVGYDIPEDTTQGEYAAMLAENKALVDALIGPENNKGCSGGGNNLDWVAAYIEAGYGYSNGAVGMAYLSMPKEVWPEGWTSEQVIVTQHSHEQVPLDLNDRMYMRQMADNNDFVHDPGGALVLSGGGLGRPDNQVADGSDSGPDGYSEAFTMADVDALVDVIVAAREAQDKTRFAKLNVHLSLDHFMANMNDVLVYFFAELQSLQDQGIIEWGTELEVYEAYLASLP